MQSTTTERTAAEPVVLSWSGGKDSSIALDRLRRDPRYDVVALLTSVTAEYDRISIHGVRRSLLEAQAAALGLPLLEVTLTPSCTNAEYESAFADGVARMRTRHPGVRRVAFGDLFLADVRGYRERLMARLGVEPLFPIWGEPTRELAEWFVAAGFRAHLVCVDTEQLAGGLVGRLFDASLLRDLPPSVDPCGERGEFHTFVFDGPIFSRPVMVRTGEIVLRDGRFAYCDLLPARAAS